MPSSKKRPVAPGAAPTINTTIPAGLMDKVRADLASRTGAPTDEAQLLRAERVTFNDGSLGCPEPGHMYTQALVEGYWIVFQQADSQYDYRATTSGIFKFCPNGKPPAKRDALM